MNFQEVLLPLDSHEHYICYTQKHPGFSPDDYRDVSHAYAWVGGLNTETTRDLMALVSIAIPAEENKANMIRQGPMHLQQTIQQRGGNASQHELESLVQQIYLAEQLASPSRALPSSVLASASGLILVRCENTCLAENGTYRQFTLRSIDAINANIVSEVDIAGKDALFNNVLKKIRKFGEPLAINPRGDSALFWAQGKVYVVDPQNKFKRVSSMTLDVERYYASWCSGRWVVLTTNASGTSSTLLLLREDTGKCLQQITLNGCARAIDSAGEFGLILVGHMGGKCDVVDITSGNVREFKPHKTILRTSFVNARISSDGTHFATWNVDDWQLMLTDISSGKSRVVADLPITKSLLYQGQYAQLDKVLSPGFGFVAGTLLSVKNGSVTQVLPQYETNAESQAETVSARVTEVTNNTPLHYDARQSPEQNIVRFGLQSAQHKILPYYWPAIHLQLKPSAGDIVVGDSKLGGQADLPNNTPWPSYNNMPMVFFAQLNLEQLSQWFPASPLPANGVLSFFIGINEEYNVPIPMGTAEEKGMWKVIHTPDLNGLRRRDTPDYPADVYDTEVKECDITFSLKGAIYPNDDSAVVKQMDLTDDEFCVYQDLIQQANPSDEQQDSDYQHQLLGYPFYIQSNDMEVMCERGYRGKDIFTSSKDPAQTQREEQASADWRLLLQLASDEENTDLLWGDAGLIYWFIRQQDLAQQNFDDTWIQFQN